MCRLMRDARELQAGLCLFIYVAILTLIGSSSREHVRTYFAIFLVHSCYGRGIRTHVRSLRPIHHLSLRFRKNPEGFLSDTAM
jgi:hypothetical protein